MAKITLNEWLVELGIIKKGIHDHYSSTFVLNTSDIDKVYSEMERKVENQISPWVVTCDPVAKTINNRRVVGRNVLGEELIDQKTFYHYSLTEDNKVKVYVERWDFDIKNARFGVEVNCKKLYYKRKFGIISE